MMLGRMVTTTNTDWHWMGFGFGAAMFFMLLIFLILTFEIWMLVDVIKNTKISAEERAIWIIGMLLVHPFVAVFYYFLRSRNKIK